MDVDETAISVMPSNVILVDAAPLNPVLTLINLQQQS
jgi:hypothetical protein